MDLSQSAYKFINGVLSCHDERPYFMKFIAKLYGYHLCSFHFLTLLVAPLLPAGPALASEGPDLKHFCGVQRRGV